MTLTAQPLDVAGAETLEIMEAAPRYNAWQYGRIAPYLGRRICEIGSGIGNMSALMLGEPRAPRELMVLTDPDPFYRVRLRERFGDRPEVRFDALTLPDPDADRYRADRLDTVVALNVVEHIEHDVAALRSIAAMLQPGGRAVVLVPALPALYGELDRELGHFRRYTRASLGSALTAAGLRVERLFYFNLVGCLGWWWNARLRPTGRIPLRQLRAFDALVPLFRVENVLPLPLGQSVVGVARA